ncbi:hypothetical protein AAF712_006138 [Marasmius tenuissimus]|uniref:Uncharacterized protein n=1 Tax=Marasmius tenuissimus TaxID=585030 RepID=A0ABR3A2E1_9AGAR
MTEEPTFPELFQCHDHVRADGLTTQDCKHHVGPSGFSASLPRVNKRRYPSYEEHPGYESSSPGFTLYWDQCNEDLEKMVIWELV